MDKKLTQAEFEDLCTWADGELDPKRADEIARLVDKDPLWGQAHRKLQSLDEALNTWTTSNIPVGLCQQIIKQAKRPLLSPWNRMVRWATPIAAAAAIVVGITLHFNSTPPGKTNLAKPNRFVSDGRDAVARMGSPVSPTTRPTVSGKYLSRNAPSLLTMTPEDQQELLARYEHMVAASARWHEQNRWLVAVIASFTPKQLEQLRSMTPSRRARIFLMRRNKLIRTGKLPKQ